MELKLKCDAVEKRESEKRQLEEKKHQEEISSLKKTNQQLKVCQDLQIYHTLCDSLSLSHTHTHKQTQLEGIIVQKK